MIKIQIRIQVYYMKKIFYYLSFDILTS